MDKEIIRRVGVNNGLKGETLEVFIEFFSKRFPDESNSVESYVNEWANRFKGNPIIHMDSHSKEIYVELVGD